LKNALGCSFNEAKAITQSKASLDKTHVVKGEEGVSVEAWWIIENVTI
jgi:hypothetical protein